MHKVIISSLSIICCFVTNTSAQNKATNYIKYYQLICKAELAVDTFQAHQESLDFYKQAFNIVAGKKKDFLNATFISQRVEDSILSAKYLQNAFLAGSTLKELRAHKHYDTIWLKKPVIKKVLSRYPQLHKQYEESQKEEQQLREQVLAFEIVKEAKKYTPMQLDFHPERKPFYKKEREKLKKLIIKKGFPIWISSKKG